MKSQAEPRTGDCASGSAPLDGVSGTALLANGRSVDIAPAAPADLARVRTFYERLSDTATYSRFFGIRRAIPERELRSVVAQDVPHHVTLLASIDNELIGIGEFVMSEKPDEAEVAFAVADDHHREGVATLLLERLAVVARRCGLKQLVAQTLPDNCDMLLVFRTVGLAEQIRFDGGVVNVTLDLSTLDHLEAEAEIRHNRRYCTGGTMSSEVTELSPSDCELLLASLDIGRVAVVDNGYPLVFPINYKMALFGGKSVIAIRTRPDNVIDHPGRAVCFEIDGIDASHDGGWSVLVRGVLVESSPDPDHDPHPIDSEDRDAWRIIVPTHVSGRRVTNRSARWSFHPAGYL